MPLFAPNCNWCTSLICYNCEFGTALEAADGTSWVLGCCVLPTAFSVVLGAVAPPIAPISFNILHCWMRNQFAQKFGMKSSLVGDAMASFCWPCGMAQITHELTLLGAHNG